MTEALWSASSLAVSWREVNSLVGRNLRESTIPRSGNRFAENVCANELLQIVPTFGKVRSAELVVWPEPQFDEIASLFSDVREDTEGTRTCRFDFRSQFAHSAARRR